MELAQAQFDARGLRELWATLGPKIPFDILAKALEELGASEQPDFGRKFEKRYADVARRLGLEGSPTLQGLWRAACSVGFSAEQFRRISALELCVVLEAKAAVLDRRGGPSQSMSEMDEWALAVKTKLRLSGGRPIGCMADGKKLRQLRGEMKQETIAVDCGISLDTWQRGESEAETWSESMFVHVASALTRVLGIPVSPKELKKIKPH